MVPQPKYEDPNHRGSHKLLDKVAIITGGDSGIGRAVAVFFASEGADISLVYLNEHDDVAITQKAVEAKGRACLSLSGDLSDPSFCKQAIEKTLGVTLCDKNSSHSKPRYLFQTGTPHHLWLTRQDLLANGLHPHYYCLPVVKTALDRATLIRAATRRARNRLSITGDIKIHPL